MGGGGHRRLLLPTGRRGLLGAYSSEKRKAQGALDQTELVAGGSVSGYTSGKGLSDAALPAFAAKTSYLTWGRARSEKKTRSLTGTEH